MFCLKKSGSGFSVSGWLDFTSDLTVPKVDCMLFSVVKKVGCYKVMNFIADFFGESQRGGIRYD